MNTTNYPMRRSSHIWGKLTLHVHGHCCSPPPSRVLLFAGTETSSGILGRILHQLALFPDAQDRLREELAAARDFAEQDLDYDRLMGLSYLDAICRETPRLYGQIPARTCHVVTDSASIRYPGVSINPRVYVDGQIGRLLHELM